MNRIKQIIHYLPNDIEHLYDLFCDHGKLGFGYSHLYPKTQVTFIDNKKHILDGIMKFHKNKPLFEFRCEDARLSQFKKNSTITMLGTGSYLVMDCLSNYKKQAFYDSYQFFIAVNMHHFELRHFLIENNIYSECVDIISDGKYSYELIKTIKDKQRLEIFNQNEWDLSNPIQKQHLLSKLKSYRNKKELLPWEKTLLTQLQNFLL